MLVGTVSQVPSKGAAVVDSAGVVVFDPGTSKNAAFSVVSSGLLPFSYSFSVTGRSKEAEAMFTKSEADAENDDKGASFRLSSSLSSSFSKHQNPSASCPTTLYPRGTGKGKTGVASAAGVEGGACHGVLHSEQYATEERFRNVHMWHAHFPVDDVAPVDASTRAGVDDDEDEEENDDEAEKAGPKYITDAVYLFGSNACKLTK
mmetsp:Transcript_76100/g.149055  ORF Transcript_76100/g.149055 Transcript_76100/m.149055 type:complete len:204 (+) Transcript_76100:218-829(+)